MHETVLLREAVAALDIKADGIYVDGTLGRGGHSAQILAKLSHEGVLVACDKDQSAIEYARQRFPGESRLVFFHGSFADIKTCIASMGKLGAVDGILLDLGVSSPQLDEAERGFSFMRDGPLDMRMDQSSGITAAQWLNRAELSEIRHVLRVYGEERFAALIARHIVDRRQQRPFSGTLELAKLIADVVPTKAWEKGKHPATRSFQAIRIYINHELEDLQKLLADCIEILASGGRLVVISFHSLEDRIVKNFIRDQERGPQLPRSVPIINIVREPHVKSVGKAVRASETEVKANIRARSAIMRVAEKVAA